MWCTDCQQDVPGIAAQDNAITCARCGARLSRCSASPYADGDAPALREANAPDGKVELDGELDPAGPAVRLDDWQLEEDLQTAERLVAKHQISPPSTGEPQPDTGVGQGVWLEPRQIRADGGHPTPELLKPHRSGHARQWPRGWLAWTFLSIGTMTFVCGAVLSALSFTAGHGQLWDIGLPLVLSGQAALLLGLIFQLEGLWQSTRETSETLDELDSQITDLQRAATLARSSQTPTAQSFYAHMAEGASPHLLLADLKGQLDMLAVRMSRER